MTEKRGISKMTRSASTILKRSINSLSRNLSTLSGAKKTLSQARISGHKSSLQPSRSTSLSLRNKSLEGQSSAITNFAFQIFHIVFVEDYGILMVRSKGRSLGSIRKSTELRIPTSDAIRVQNMRDLDAANSAVMTLSILSGYGSAGERNWHEISKEIFLNDSPNVGRPVNSDILHRIASNIFDTSSVSLSNLPLGKLSCIKQLPDLQTPDFHHLRPILMCQYLTKLEFYTKLLCNCTKSSISSLEVKGIDYLVDLSCQQVFYRGLTSILTDLHYLATSCHKSNRERPYRVSSCGLRINQCVGATNRLHGIPHYAEQDDGPGGRTMPQLQIWYLRINNSSTPPSVYVPRFCEIGILPAIAVEENNSGQARVISKVESIQKYFPKRPQKTIFCRKFLEALKPYIRRLFDQLQINWDDPDQYLYTREIFKIGESGLNLVILYEKFAEDGRKNRCTDRSYSRRGVISSSRAADSELIE
ncbi:MAG: hypothetical protein MHMPM18_002549 [Marteilia pararefringens]